MEAVGLCMKELPRKSYHLLGTGNCEVRFFQQLSPSLVELNFHTPGLGSRLCFLVLCFHC